MKIHASRSRRSGSELEQYIGKDLWVKVNERWDNHRDIYIQILDIDDRGKVYFNKIDAWVLDDFTTYRPFMPTSLIANVKQDCVAPKYAFTIIEPAEVLTMDELVDRFNSIKQDHARKNQQSVTESTMISAAKRRSPKRVLDTSDINEFEEYVGLDLWLLVYDYRDHNDWYIRVLGIDNNWQITYNGVTSWDVENGYGMEGISEAITYITTHELHCPASDLYLKYPLQCYTTEEIIDGFKGKYAL